MNDHVTCSGEHQGARILNMAGLYMQGLYRVMNMSDYGSIRLNNA